MRIDNKNIFKLINSGLLLVPGFLYAILALVISGNVLFPHLAAESLFLLNIAQLISFGVTIAKYAADQMLLSKLSPFEKVALGHFFKKRVLPLSILFSIFLLFTNSYWTAIGLCVLVPIDVFVIIVIFELNITKRYIASLFLNLLGYPLIFIAYILLSFKFHLTKNEILLLFLLPYFIKLIAAFQLRNNGQLRQDVLVLSPYVPIQQAGNYLLFKIDQLFIANNFIGSMFFQFNLPINYLFYTKITEIFSGIATSLSPIIVRHCKTDTEAISIKPLLKNSLFKFITIAAIIVQILLALFFIHQHDKLHLLLLIPFAIITILIIPVNINNYELYRTNNLKKSNFINLLCFLVTAVVMLINIQCKSILLFAFMVPIQMFTFFLINQFVNLKKNV